MKRAQNAIVAAVLSLGACSPYAYSDKVEELAAVGAGLQSIFQTNRQLLVKETNQADKLSWLSFRPQIALSNCAPADESPCRIIDKAAEPSRLLSIGPRRPAEQVAASRASSDIRREERADVCELVRLRATELTRIPNKTALEGKPVQTREDVFRSLSTYLNGLQAVTNAKDRSEFDVSASKLSAAIGSLVGTAATIAGVPGGALVGPVVTAGSNVFLWIVGTNLDNQRYQALRASVIQACQPVRILSAAIGVFLEEQQGMRVGQDRRAIISQENLTDQNRRARDAVYGANLDHLFQLVADYNAVRTPHVVELTQAFADAHDKLVLAVWNNDGQFETVYKALNELGTRMEALLKSVEALQTTQSPK